MGEAAEKVYPALTDAGVMCSLLMDVAEDCPTRVSKTVLLVGHTAISF
jgi:hypothetical protein